MVKSAAIRSVCAIKSERTARKLMIYSMSSNEVISDAPDFENQLTVALVKGLSWYLDLAFISGTGSGEPRGFLNDDAVIEVAKESGQTADTITLINLQAMFARLHPASVKNSIWLCSSTTIPQLLPSLPTPRSP